MSTSSAAIQTFTVEGMTCGHCVQSVTKEVSAVSGVTAVSVDLGSGRLQVTGDQVETSAISEAVEEAGYQLKPPS